MNVIRSPESMHPRAGTSVRAARVGVWLGCALVLVLSLVPHAYEIRTGAHKDVEHAVAYLLFAGVVGYGYGRPTRYVRLILLLCALSGFLELAQFLSPGRTPSLLDFLASSFGAAVGTAGATLLRKHCAHPRRGMEQTASEPAL